jgi:hypothetical protein
MYINLKNTPFASIDPGSNFWKSSHNNYRGERVSRCRIRVRVCDNRSFCFEVVVDVGVSERSDSGSRRCGGVSSRLEQSLLLEHAEERGH